MLSEKNKYEDELSNVMNALADSVLEMSDEEIEQELQEEGDDSEDIRQILLNGIKRCRQKNLREAQERHQKNVLFFQNTHYEIPENPADKRDLIQSMLGSLAAQQQSSLTLQFRDYESMPDEDLDGVLLQLFALTQINSSTEK